MPRVNRNQLLQELQAVAAGLSQSESFQQSSCFVFKDGQVITYNDEISCSFKTGLPSDIEGAIVAAPLLALLGKMTEEEVEIIIAEGELIIIGKKRRAGITMEAKILLPLSELEKPTTWKTLPEDFGEGVNIVQECATKDEHFFVLTCIHLTPKYIEACDNFQLSRYAINTGLKSNILVKRDCLKHVAVLGMTEFSESKTWIHFRNPAGLIMSCRRYIEEYPDLKDLLDLKQPRPATLPKGLGPACEKAEIFSSESTTSPNRVLIELRAGQLRVKGQGTHGWFSEIKNLAYDGGPLAFLISPKLLQEITKKHNDCELSEDKLRVRGGKFTYVTCLSRATDKAGPEKTEGS